MSVGLIYTLSDGGSIENLTIAKGSTIKGQSDVGAFVGNIADDATVTIKGVTNHATVEGVNNYVGGLVGTSSHNGILTIDNSSNTGNVKGAQNIGGFIGSVGLSTLTVTDSSNTGNVTGFVRVGGLVGTSAGNVILTNVYSYAKKVIGTHGTNFGGIVGDIQDNTNTFTANNVYWLHDNTEGIDKAVGTTTGIPSGTLTPTSDAKSLTIAEFAVDNNFKPAWDFVKVWEILANGKYPTLRNLPVAPVTTK